MSQTQSPQMSPSVWIMLITLSVIWGGSFLFGRIAMLEWPPFTVALLRVALAAIALWLFLKFTSRRFPVERTFIGAVIVMGLLNNAIPFSMILIGQQELGAGLASVVNAMTPIWTLIIANFMTSDEKITGNKLLGILAGFAGVAVLMGTDIAGGLAASALAQAAVLVATISYGFAGVYGKRFKGRDPVVVATGQLTASTAIMLPLALLVEQPWNLAIPSLPAIGSIVLLALLCTSVAYVLFFRILDNAGATNLSLVTFLIPVSAILCGILFLSETLSVSDLTGIALIALGLVLVDGRLHRAILRPKPGN